MRTRHDQLGKQMLRASLEDRGTFTPAMEVSPDPQEADGFLVPDLRRVSRVEPTLLGRMTKITCSFEVFSSPPDGLETEGCIRKHMNLRHILRKNHEEHKLPHQWLLCAGKPESALDAFWARPAADWPRGVYELRPPDATSILVLSELPEERSTLFLRLMGRGLALKRAIQELKMLPDGEFEKSIALPLLVRYRFEAQAEPVSPGDEEFIVNSQELVDMLQRTAELRGELRGELQGQRKTVLHQLRRKFGILPDDVVTRVQNADGKLLEKLEDNVLFANSLDDVFSS
jgi:hypothetical protein